MVNRLLAHPIVHVTATSAILLSVLICIIPELFPAFSWVINYAVQLMLIYLIAGLVMLVCRQPKLTFSFFGGCVLLCFFLKYSVKSDGIERWRQLMIARHNTSDQNLDSETNLKIAHINLTNASDASEVIDALRSANADLLSIHEVTPDWDKHLRDSLLPTFPYQHTMVDIGIFGMAIYSKYRLDLVDTFFYKEVPNLSGYVQKNDETFNFISVHTQPALNDYYHKRLKEHLGVICQELKKARYPIVVFGDFNSVSWSSQMQVFLNEAGLMDSRKGFIPYTNPSTSSLWETHLDHIFFSRQLQCSVFENITGHQKKHLGIAGIYSRKPLVIHAKQTAQ